jgi:hypothetical protein
MFADIPCIRVANPDRKKSPKTPDLVKKNRKFLAENPLNFPKNTYNSPKMHEILPKILI